MGASYVKRHVLILAGTAALAAAGCAGGGGSNVAPATVNSASRQTASTTVVVRFTDGSGVSSAVRKTQALSAFTNGISVTAYPTGTTRPSSPTVNFNVNRSSTICTNNTDGSRSCALTFPAPVGNDTFVFDAYDQVPNSTFTAPQGNMISSGSIQQTIAAGSPATLTVAMNGVVAAVGFAYGPTAPTYAIGSPTTTNVGLTFNDATNTPIIGTFANTVTISSSDASVTIGNTGGTMGSSLVFTSPPTAAIALAYSGATLVEALVSASSGGPTLGVLKVRPNFGDVPVDATIQTNTFERQYSICSGNVGPNANGSPPPQPFIPSPGPSASPTPTPVPCPQATTLSYPLTTVTTPNVTYNGVNGLIKEHTTFADNTPSQSSNDAYLQYTAGSTGITNVTFPYATYAYHSAGYNETDQLAWSNQIYDMLPESAGMSWTVDLTRTHTFQIDYAPSSPTPQASDLVHLTQVQSRAANGTFTRTNSFKYYDAQTGNQVATQNADGSGTIVETEPSYFQSFTNTYGAISGGTQSFSRTVSAGPSPLPSPVSNTLTIPVPAALQSAPLLRSVVTIAAVSSSPTNCFIPAGIGTVTLSRSQHTTNWRPVLRQFLVSDQTDYIVPNVGPVCTTLATQTGFYDRFGNWFETDVDTQTISISQAAISDSRRAPAALRAFGSARASLMMHTGDATHAEKRDR